LAVAEAKASVAKQEVAVAESKAAVAKQDAAVAEAKGDKAATQQAKKELVSAERRLAAAQTTHELLIENWRSLQKGVSVCDVVPTCCLLSWLLVHLLTCGACF
jgi:hypothetical protein